MKGALELRFDNTEVTDARADDAVPTEKVTAQPLIQAEGSGEKEGAGDTAVTVTLGVPTRPATAAVKAATAALEKFAVSAG